MSTNTENTQEYCPNCTRLGLPILPLRYAVAWNSPEIKITAPGLVAPFGQGVSDIVLPPNKATYTLRTLRGGYLYLFNEVRGQWKAYLVSDNAELTEYDYRQKAPINTNRLSLVCSRHGNPPLAKCVIIPDAGNSGKIWFAFSDTEWTPQVFKQHRSQAWRERHMHVIDVKSWVSSKGASQAHVASMDNIGQRVSEYSVPIPKRSSPDGIDIVGYKAFQHVSEPLATLSPETESLLKAAKDAGKQWGYLPAMIAVNDPVGITGDLASLIKTELQEEVVVRRRGEVRALAVSSAIQNIQNFIWTDAENRQIYRSQQDARQALDAGYMAGGDGGAGARAGMALAEALFPRMRQEREELYDRWSHPSPAEMRQAKKDAWEKYKKKYDEKKLNDWQKSWGERLSAYDTSVILPLARAHVKWMESKPFYEHMECSHDDKDSKSSKGFVESMLLAIQDTQQYSPCFNLYEKWLSATKIDKKNLIIRALGLNQKAVLDQLDKVAQGGLEPASLKGLPWDGLIGGYDNAIGAMGHGARDTVVRMTAALGGVFARVAQKSVDRVIGPGLVALGVIAKAPVVMVDVVMSKANAITELVARMASLNPKVSDLSGLNRAIEIEMRKARVYGTPLQGTGRFRYLIMADARVVEDFPGVDAQGNARRFAESIVLTEADRQRLTQIRWRKLLPSAAGLGVVTGILQTVALGKLASDLDQSMVHEKVENRRRFITACVALGGTLADTVGKWSESAIASGSRFGTFIEQYLGRALRFVAKGVGIGVGVVMAIWDVIRGVQELKEGNAIGWLYIGSAVVSVAALTCFTSVGAFLFGAAATGIGIVLVVLVVVIAVLIEIFKDNKLQDWMERSYFGRFSPADRYQDAEVELRELDIALAG